MRVVSCVRLSVPFLIFSKAVATVVAFTAQLAVLRSLDSANYYIRIVVAAQHSCQVDCTETLGKHSCVVTRVPLARLSLEMCIGQSATYSTAPAAYLVAEKRCDQGIRLPPTKLQRQSAHQATSTDTRQQHGKTPERLGAAPTLSQTRYGFCSQTTHRVVSI